MNYISSLNFRIARQKIGCSNRIINEILDLGNNSVHNTLIISPPGCGKTTLLRDIIRNVSNGIKILSFAGKQLVWLTKEAKLQQCIKEFLRMM